MIHKITVVFCKIKWHNKNLSIVDSYFESNRCYYASTFAGITYGDIENCYSSATVSGRSMCGGIAGVTDRKYLIAYLMVK